LLLYRSITTTRRFMTLLNVHHVRIHRFHQSYLLSYSIDLLFRAMVYSFYREDQCQAIFSSC
jgi:hypothetical protein